MKMEISPEEIKTYKNKHSLLGKGGFGRVHVCLYREEMCAIKLTQLSGAADCMDKTIKDVMHEAEIMKKMEVSRYIIGVFGIVRCDCWMGIVMEFAPRSDLQWFIKDTKSEINLGMKLRIVYEIAAGLTHLHGYSFDKRISHNDLKPSNILLDEDLHVKISDFGGSNFLARTTGCQTHCLDLDEVSNVHTAHYTAPEFSEGHPRTKEMDMFSFAMVIYFLLAHEDPFETEPETANIRGLYKAGKRPQEPRNGDTKNNEEIFNILTGIMKKCWYGEPKFRPPIDVIREQLKPHNDRIAGDVEKFVEEYTRIPAVRKWECKPIIPLESLCASLNSAQAALHMSNDSICGQATAINKINVDSLPYPLKNGDTFMLNTSREAFECVVVRSVADRKRCISEDNSTSSLEEFSCSTSRGSLKRSKLSVDTGRHRNDKLYFAYDSGCLSKLPTSSFLKTCTSNSK